MASTTVPPATPVVSRHSHDRTILTFLLALIRTTTKLLRVNTTKAMNPTFLLLALPVELRLIIYEHTILSQRRYRFVNHQYHQTRIICPPALLLASHALRNEALPIFHRIASAEAHIFISGMRNLHAFVHQKTHLLPRITRLTLMAWTELGQSGIGYVQRVDLCEQAERDLKVLVRGCERLVFLRLQLDVLGRMSEGVVRGTLWVLGGLRSGVRVLGDGGTMRVLGAVRGVAGDVEL